MANRFLKSFVAVLVLNLLVLQAHAAKQTHFDAKIYDLKDHSKLMFNYKSEFEIDGNTKTYINTITDLQGQVLVVDTAVLTLDGEKETLVSFEQDQKQVGTLGKVEIRDGKAFFSFTKDGKTKTDDEKFSDDFVVSPTVVKLLQANWDRISKGETVKVRLAVLDRQETVGFQFKKESEKEILGAPGVVLKMKASSVIISALVNPLYFGFSADGKRLLELEGRTSAKLKVDGKFKDFDGYTVYTYPEAAVITPPATTTDAKKPEKKPAKKSKK